MKSQKIIYHFGNALDIVRVKSMQVLRGENEKHNLVFELNERTAFVLNPTTNTWEKELFNDIVKIAYDDFEMANAYFLEWAEIWHDFADDQQQ